MLIFVEKTTPIKVKVRLPYIDEALENFAELVSNYRNNQKSYRTAYLTLFNECVDKIDDKEKAFILEIIQDWDEVRYLFEEKSDSDVQEKLNMLKKGGQNKSKPEMTSNSKQEDSEHGVPSLPGSNNGVSAWTPGKIISTALKQ